MNLSLAYWFNFKQKSDDGEEEREREISVKGSPEIYGRQCKEVIF